MNNACHIDFFQTSERILAELDFEHTAPGLTARVATDWAAETPIKHYISFFLDIDTAVFDYN